MADDVPEDDDELNAKADENAAEEGDEPQQEGESAQQEQPVEEEVKEPDHPDTVAALRDLGARLDTNERGNVWRIFLYDKHGDKDLAQIHGLPSLKELWLLGTKVTRRGAEEIRAKLPGVKVYY